MLYKTWSNGLIKIPLEDLKNSTKMFAKLKSIDLYSFLNDLPSKRRGAKLWSCTPPSFKKINSSAHNFTTSLQYLIDAHVEFFVSVLLLYAYIRSYFLVISVLDIDVYILYLVFRDAVDASTKLS
jgi:hypothetical protein